MAALRSRCGYYIFVLWFHFFLVSSSFFSSPNLSSRRLDVCHTFTHDVALVQIWNAGLKCAACGSLEMQDSKIAKNSPSGHHRTTLSGSIFATKAHVDNRKKNFLNRNVSPICPYIMVNFGPLAAQIILLVWDTPANVNGFRVLAALLHGTLVADVSQTLRR